jgi:hypothetical protein
LALKASWSIRSTKSSTDTTTGKHTMGSLKKRRKTKINKHKRKKRARANRHKKRLRYKN